MEILGYIASLGIGISLGLIGGGGSVLTLPVLLYLFYIEPRTAIAYSLLIVGFSSFIGSISYFKKKLVNLGVIVWFGLPSVLAVFLTRKLLLPTFPDVFELFGIQLKTDMILILAFGIIMILAANKMIQKEQLQKNITKNTINPNVSLILLGLLVGLLTGLLGAGGGFLIIPVLVNFLNMDIKAAIGTSLAIIAINSLFGFTFSIGSVHLDWAIIGGITAASLLGIVIGSYLSTKIDGKKLKPAFGYCILVMGLFIVIKNIIQYKFLL